MTKATPTHPLELKKKRQILITFLVSIAFSSVLVFFAVYTRTAQLLEQEKLEQQSKKTGSELEQSEPDKSSLPHQHD